MPRMRLTNFEEFEERHPGACRQIEAMFKAGVAVRVVIAVLQAQYGESIGDTSLRSYRLECQDIWRNQTNRQSAHLPIGSSAHRATERSDDQPVESSGDLKARSAAAGALACQ